MKNKYTKRRDRFGTKNDDLSITSLLMSSAYENNFKTYFSLSEKSLFLKGCSQIITGIDRIG